MQLWTHLNSGEKKTWKKWGFKGIRTHDLCDALPTELSSQVGAGYFVNFCYTQICEGDVSAISEIHISF